MSGKSHPDGSICHSERLPGCHRKPNDDGCQNNNQTYVEVDDLKIKIRMQCPTCEQRLAPIECNVRIVISQGEYDRSFRLQSLNTFAGHKE